MARAAIPGGSRWALGGLLGLGLALLTVQAADAATLRLGPDCGPTIQDCVDAASDDDLILVPPKKGKGKPNDGYYENVVVDKGVTIRGVANNRSTTCFDPRQAIDDLGRLRRNKVAVVVDAAPDGDPGGVGFEIVPGGNGATIECFVVRHGSNATLTDVSQEDVTFSKLVAIGQNVNGINLAGNGHRVLDSLVIGADAVGVLGGGDDLLVRGTWVRSVAMDCFAFGGNNIRIENSHARRCGDPGFIGGVGFFLAGDQPQVSDSTADSTAGTGFVIACTGVCGDGFARRNTASNARPVIGVGFVFQISDPGFEISGNRAFKNHALGFLLNTNGAELTDNIAERNGAPQFPEDGHGFVFDPNSGGPPFASNNILLRNVARFNKRDGFFIQGDGNVLGDGTEENRNRAIRNLMDGFDIQSGDGNTLDNNEAASNEGDGIENNATNTELRNNDSAGNRIDCAADVPPTVDTGNFCSDNSDFTVPPETERQDSTRRTVERIRAEVEQAQERAQRGSRR